MNPVSTPIDEQAIRTKAYELWCAKGYPAGSAEDDWYEALQLLGRTPANTVSPDETRAPSVRAVASLPVAKSPSTTPTKSEPAPASRVPSVAPTRASSVAPKLETASAKPASAEPVSVSATVESIPASVSESVPARKPAAATPKGKAKSKSR